MSAPYREPATILMYGDQEPEEALESWVFGERDPHLTAGRCPKCASQRLVVVHFCSGQGFWPWQCRVRREHLHVNCRNCNWNGLMKTAPHK